MGDREVDPEEARARAAGWVPPEEYKGDPGKAVGYEEFNRRGENILPIVQAKKRELEQEVDELRESISDIRNTSRQFKEFYDSALKRAREEKQSLIAELDEVKKRALDENDGEKFIAAEKKQRELQEEMSKPNGNEPPAVAKSWMSKNPWYGQDVVLTDQADRFGYLIATNKPELRGTQAYYDELDSAMREWQETASNPNRSRQTVEDARGKASSQKGRTFEDLPEEARLAFQAFKDEFEMSEDDYLKNYTWDQGE